jgi:hypothetical protein
MDELPKRAKSLGAPVASWLKELIRRCAMGGLLNVDVVSNCIQLALEAFQSEEYAVATAFLSSIKIVVHIFPSIIGTEHCFGGLVELFGSCIETTSSDKKKKIQELGLLTTLSGLLAVAASSRPPTLTEIDKVSETNKVIRMIYYVSNHLFPVSEYDAG